MLQIAGDGRTSLDFDPSFFSCRLRLLLRRAIVPREGMRQICNDRRGSEAPRFVHASTRDSVEKKRLGQPQCS